MRSALILALLFSAACRTPYPKYGGGSREAPVRITFEAPDTPFVQTSVTRRVEKTPGGTLVAEELVELVTRVSFLPMPEGDSGFLLTQSVESLKSTPARPPDAPLSQALSSVPLRLQLASDGSFIRLINGETFTEAFRAALPEGAAGALTATTLEEDVRREWVTRYGLWFGKNVTSGQRVHSLERLPLAAGGALHYVLERTVAGVVDGPDGRKLVLALRCLGAIPENAEVKALVDDAALEPSVKCEGREELNLTPFRPLEAILTLTATPDGRGEVAFSRKSQTRLEVPNG